MPREEGGGVQSSELKFATDANGNLIVLLEDFPEEMRSMLQRMVTNILCEGIEKFGQSIEVAQAAGAIGVKIPYDRKGLD